MAPKSKPNILLIAIGATVGVIALIAALFYLQKTVLSDTPPSTPSAVVNEEVGPNGLNETEAPVDYSFSKPSMDDRAVAGITDEKLVDEATLAKIKEQLHTEYDTFAKENADKIPAGSVVDFDEAITSCMNTEPKQTERECVKNLYFALRTTMFERAGGAPAPGK